jgi:tRNA A-37 threonylcarbamoyl transferase component Bud32
MLPLRQRTLEAYITLHDHGIIHGDLEPRHIRVRVPDRQTRWSPTLAVKVIDFEGAKLFRQDAALAARRAAEELKRVEDLLSAQGFTG